MSLKRPFAWIAALVVVISVASVARAQTMPVSHASHVGANPFLEPDYFRPDFQFFSPSQVDPYSGGEPPNLGFYGTYDRVYMNVSRPDAPNENSPSGIPGDFGSGWRFDLGYMTPERKGWEVSAWHIGGPNAYLVTQQERINRHNDDDPSDGLGGGTTGGGGAATTAVLPQDANPRTYFLSDSLNVVHFSSFEMNKVWRFKEFHYGGVFEPLVGLRYMQFIDFSRRDSYQRFAADALIEPDLSTPNTAGPFEFYNTNRSQFQNTMLGGQIGFRYSKQTGHWLLSTEFRAFAMQNWQFFTIKQQQTVTLYDSTDTISAIVLREINTQAQFDTHRAEVVWGGELRAEAAYEITRDVSIRGGFVMLDLGKGIGRGQNSFQNTQDVFMWGWTAGFTLNR